MTRTCNVCSHSDRDAIERDLLNHMSYRTLASSYVELSKDSAHKHATNCIPKLLAKARDAQDLTRADALLWDLALIRTSAIRALEGAESAGDNLTMLRAIREVRENLRVMGEMRGVLDAQGSQRALISPVALSLIVQVLAPHPEIAQDVVDALEPLEELDAG